MTEEERAALYRSEVSARSVAVAARLAALRGSQASRQAFTLAWRPWVDRRVQIDDPPGSDELPAPLA